jgi:glycosyltransferase involved in cell wall biosynthesis
VRILGFGTYDGARQPRVSVLLRGLEELGAEVEELNLPLGFSTAERVAMLHRPWLLYRLGFRILRRWTALTWRRSRLRPAPDVVVVGYLAQFDVILARLLFPRTVIALDLLVFADDTAKDRGLRVGTRTRVLRWLDRVAIGCATLVIVDTEEHLALLGSSQRDKAVVAAVGAAESWFRRPKTERQDRPLQVVFFGLFTPLQGAPVIGSAIAALPADLAIEISMVGTGQDFAETRARVGDDPRVTWVPWIEPESLPEFVAEHDICLGVFGTTDKALRVVPTKVFQGAAAGCAIVTSDTTPQRRTLGDSACYVPAGEPGALASALVGLSGRPSEVLRLRRAAYELASRSFRPVDVAAPVLAALQDLSFQETK